MLGINMRDVNAAGGNRPGAGGYVIRIMNVVNNKQRERLEIEYDIAEGEYKGHYTEMKQRRGWWGGKFMRSYKENAQPFFKAFIETVCMCNDGAPGLVVGDYDDIDETKLPGKLLGIIYGMEEYRGNDGRLKTRPDHFNAEFVSLDVIHSGEYEVPDFKPYEGGDMPPQGGVVDMSMAGFGALTEDETPF